MEITIPVLWWGFMIGFATASLIAVTIFVIVISKFGKPNGSSKQ